MEEEIIAVQLIANSGQARSLAFEALALAKEGNFNEAENKIKEAGELIILAHQAQTSLIQREAGGDKVAINLLMVHAQDHLMTSMLAKDLIKEFLGIMMKNTK